MAQRLCLNMNHRRRDSPVAFCPNCGEVVNAGIPPRICSEQSHAKQRRERNRYCVDCGEQLIPERRRVPGCSTKHRRRDGAHSCGREEAEPGDSISGRRCEGLPPHRGEKLPLCVFSVPPVGLPLGRAQRPLHPLVPLRSYASPRRGRTGTRPRALRSRRAAEALPGATGVNASPRPTVCAKS